MVSTLTPQRQPAGPGIHPHPDPHALSLTLKSNLVAAASCIANNALSAARSPVAALPCGALSANFIAHLLPIVFTNPKQVSDEAADGTTLALPELHRL
jgi:hypothetical protein